MIEIRKYFKDYRYIPSYNQMSLLKEFVRYEDVISLKDRIIREAVEIYKELGNDNADEFNKRLNKEIYESH
jgi:hypothetical protein